MKVTPEARLLSRFPLDVWCEALNNTGVDNTLPDALIFPTTSNFCDGVVVPIPTLPKLLILKTSVGG